MNEWDLLNWQTMAIELIIATILAATLSVYFYIRQERRQKELESIICEQKKILDEQYKYKESRKKYVYHELQINLEFVYRTISFLDKQKNEFLKTNSHNNKANISAHIQKLPNNASKLDSILHLNNDIIEPKIYELIENCISNIMIYHDEKYKISIFAKNQNNKNKLLEQLDIILKTIDQTKNLMR